MRDKWFLATHFLSCADLTADSPFLCELHLLACVCGRCTLCWVRHRLLWDLRGDADPAGHWHISCAVKGESKLKASAVGCTIYPNPAMHPLTDSILAWSEPGVLEGFCRYPGKWQGAAAMVFIKTAPTVITFVRKKRRLAGSSNNFSRPVSICSLKSVWLQERERHRKRDWLQGESHKPHSLFASPFWWEYKPMVNQHEHAT